MNITRLPLAILPFGSNSKVQNKNNVNSGGNVYQLNNRPYKDVFEKSVRFKGNSDDLYSADNCMKRLSEQHLNFTNDSNPTISGMDEHNLNASTELFNRFMTNNLNPEDTAKHLATSADGIVYTLSNGKISLIAKTVHTPQTAEASPLGAMVLNSQKSEVDALKKIPGAVKHTCRYVASATDEYGNVKAFALTKVPGSTLHGTNIELTNDHLKGALKDILDLDRGGVYHRDLSIVNHMADEHNMYIIDYGVSKDFDEMTDLARKADPKQADSTKYLLPNHVAFSNLDMFEGLTLSFYLRQLANGKDGGKEKADKLYLQYLKDKSNFHAEKAKMLENSEEGWPSNPKNKEFFNRDEVIKNEKARAAVFAKITPNNPNNKFTRDVKSIEVLRMKMGQAQKKARIYSNPDKDRLNPLTTFYWSALQGFYAAGIANKTDKLLSRYQNDKDMTNYLKAEKKTAEFYKDKIYKPMIKVYYDNLSWALNDPDAVKTITEDDGNRLALKDIHGNWTSQGHPIYHTGPVVKGDY